VKKNFFIKIFSGYLFIISLFILFIFIFSFSTLKSIYIRNLTSELKDLCQVLKPQIVSFMNNNDIQGLNKYVKNLDNKIQKRITIVDINGKVLADSEKDPNSMDNHKNREEIIQALNGRLGVSTRYSPTLKQDMLYVAIPIQNNNNLRRDKTRHVSTIKNNNKIIGIVRVSVFLQNVKFLVNKLKFQIIYFLIIMLFLSLITAFIFSKNLADPIKQFKNAINKITQKDFNVKVVLKNKDEIGELANTFNYMTEEIAGLFSALSEKKDELNIIIDSISEGLFVTDENGKIKFSNKSFRKIIGDNNINGKFYWEILRQEDFKKLIEKAKSQYFLQSDFVVDNKIYFCNIKKIESKNEYLIVMQDITQVRNLENKKKEFVANVSHELRTPITAIKGYAETLEEEITGKGKEYLEIIKKHSERLINIIEDLLLLSKMEDKEFKLESSKVDIEQIIENVISLFKEKAKSKNINIRFEKTKDTQSISADAFKLEQMFINLIDNAIKYTDKGEILFKLQQDDKNTLITVEDTGIGISEKDAPYIFERFYVADKSRSKKTGGTGLGLSIVKHIVMLHKGDIKVESSLGVGTKFIIILPR
jgi:two-component system, OmpR family, phosphate regulon sensor histidine kinase PhoR